MENVKFISYTGDYPNLCSGILTLEVNGTVYTFGQDITTRFWSSGGSCGFENDYADSYVDHGEWEMNETFLPDELKQYSKEIINVFNENVPHSCCGGCL